MLARSTACRRRVNARPGAVLRIGAVVVVVAAATPAAASAATPLIVVVVLVAAAFKRFLMVGRWFFDLYRYCCSWPGRATLACVARGTDVKAVCGGRAVRRSETNLRICSRPSEAHWLSVCWLSRLLMVCAWNWNIINQYMPFTLRKTTPGFVFRSRRQTNRFVITENKSRVL